MMMIMMIRTVMFARSCLGTSGSNLKNLFYKKCQEAGVNGEWCLRVGYTIITASSTQRSERSGCPTGD